MIQSKWSAGIVGLVFALLCGLLAGCGTTVEKQQARFKKNKDTMEALAAKHPMMKTSVMAKLADFQKEHDQLVATGGENAPRDLARLNGRVEEYVRKLDPSMAPKKTTSSKKLGTTPAGTAPGAAPGSKLGGGNAPGTAPGAAPGGKLGGSAAPGAAPGTAPAAGGKLGGGAAPGTAPAGKLGGAAPGTAPGTAPAAGGKLGGSAAPGAAPGTAPAGKLGGGTAPTAPAGKLGGGTAPTAPAGKLGGQ